MSADHVLEGRVALVTGASRGIGAAIAERFAAAGAAVAVTARTAEEGDHPLPGSLAGTVQSIRDSGADALAVVADLAHAEDRERIIETVRQELGPVDILVNNAAVTYFVPIEAFKRSRYDLMFEVQVAAPMHLSQLALPGMREAGAGWILNISSPAALHPAGPPYGRQGGGTVYGMCKAAIERFTTGLASELYADHIAVNCLAPTGLVVTPGVQHHHLDELIPEERHEPVSMMADAALSLCSGDPAALTGRVVFSQQYLAEL